MKNKIKNQIMLACLSASLVASAAAVTTVAVNAKAEETLVSSDLTMNVGASLYLEEISGLKFSYTVKDYTEETHGDKNYGMLIVPYDYLAKAGITDLTLATNDYVPTLQAAVGDTIANAPIVVDGLQPTEAGLVEYSIGDLYEDNYARAFFGIGFEATETADGTAYEYAVQNDNVRSVFEVANLALNKLHYGEWTESEEDVKEQALLESKETDVLNPFLTKGFAFVYGNAATPTIASATYVGGEIVPVVEVEKEKDIDLGIHWNYSVTEGDTVAEVTAEGKIKGLSRGQTTVTLSLGDVKHETATTSVLKDATEFQIYNDSEKANFFGVTQDNTSFAGKMVADGTAYSSVKFGGGYWNDITTDSAYENPGYMVIKNPESEDGKYQISTTKITMDFYFTGNNMPNVEFFATSSEDIDFGKYGGGTTGCVITNGIARNDTYYEYATTVLPSYDEETGTYDTTNWGTHSTKYAFSGIVGSSHFFRFGSSGYGAFKRANGRASYSTYFGCSYALDTTNKSSGYDVMQYGSGAWTSKALAYGSKFSMYELMKDETQQWHYKVSMQLVSSGTNKGKPAFSATLYAVTEEGETSYVSVSNKLIVSSTTASPVGASGYIVVHGALKGSKQYCKDAGNENYYYTELAYKMPY